MKSMKNFNDPTENGTCDLRLVAQCLKNCTTCVNVPLSKFKKKPVMKLICGYKVERIAQRMFNSTE